MPPARQTLNNPAKIAVIGSYIPRRCGIATFSADLLDSMRLEAPDSELWAVAMNDNPLPAEFSGLMEIVEALADLRRRMELLEKVMLSAAA
jgi:hypothetical protein